MSLKVCGLRESRLTFRRCTPALYRSAAISASSRPLVVSARCLRPGISGQPFQKTDDAGPDQRLTAGDADLLDAQPDGRFGDQQQFLVGEHRVVSLA